MKQLIFALLFMAFFLGCHESNSVEPILDNSIQQNKLDNRSDEGILVQPGQDGNTEAIEILCNYEFNPCIEGKGKCNKPLKYKYTGEHAGILYRQLLDVTIEVPSTLVINNKPFKTLHEYTINRKEEVSLLTPEMKVIDGTTWGTFKIFLVGENFKAEIFSGYFKGEILFNTANIKLTGKGLGGSYKDRSLIATEKQACNFSEGSLTCWTSNTEGKIAPRVRIDQ